MVRRFKVEPNEALKMLKHKSMKYAPWTLGVFPTQPAIYLSGVGIAIRIGIGIEVCAGYFFTKPDSDTDPEIGSG